jgi:glucose/arabinose dehydrogenase
MNQRIRDVMQTPVGAIHVIVDDKNSGLLRLTLVAG